MKYCIALLLLFCSNLGATCTVTAEGYSTTGTYPPYSLPNATVGDDYGVNGVVVKATNISPPLGTGTSSAVSQVIATWQVYGNNWPSGFTATRVEKSSTEVWFYLVGVPNDTPGDYVVSLGVVQTTHSGGYSYDTNYDIGGYVSLKLLATPGGGGSGSGKNGGSDGGCSTDERPNGVLALLAALGVLLLSVRWGYRERSR